jgi:UDP:flavonoid glycosyltransferase YjiC (YdhE family)
MHITILSHGSRGDVQPYVALGVGLQRAGHTVRLAAPQFFERFISEQGLAFAPLAGDPTRLAQALADRAGWNPLRTGLVISEYALPLAAQVQVDVNRACQGTDVVIHSFLTTIAGHQAARQLDVPDFSALLIPIFAPTAAFSSPALPEFPLGSFYNRLTHNIFTQSFWQGSRLAYNWVVRRKYPHLPRLSGWPFCPSNRRRTPILYGFSPHVIPRPPDWGEDVHVTGYWFLETAPNWHPPADLVDFLEAGPPPVYIGFGSMITRDSKKLLSVVLDALARTGQRGLLLSGWGRLGRVNLPDHVFRIESAPHDWLFPRMAAIMHHGGAGTTAAALRAGVPAIITPFTSDQPFWGQRVYQLGVGPKLIPRQKLTTEKLVQAIDLAIGDRTMRQRAAELGKRIRAEAGVARAVETIERSFA